MDFQTYFSYFEQILNNQIKDVPYDLEMIDYIKLNYSRVKRWLKTGELDQDLAQNIKNLKSKQKWVLIAEPWCGDAANITPFVYLLSKENPLIELEIQLRDQNSEIENYLTNGSKSIPVLIIRDEDEKDILVWGARPKSIQEKVLDLKSKGVAIEEIKKELQNWYNEDKGKSFQEEMKAWWIQNMN
ncbi:MAG: thioredoxin family protein [Flavobacteriia bacterium]|nr:thioredoxin family protein [Flavobacteriia bacterium]